MSTSPNTSANKVSVPLETVPLGSLLAFLCPPAQVALDTFYVRCMKKRAPSPGHPEYADCSAIYRNFKRAVVISCVIGTLASTCLNGPIGVLYNKALVNFCIKAVTYQPQSSPAVKQ